ATDRPVLFVNSLGMRMPRRGSSSAPLARVLRKVRSAARGLATPVPDLPGFHVLTPFFLPLYGDGVAASVNRLLVRAQIRLALWRLGIRRPDVVVTLPTAWPVARGLRRRRTVAYRSDRYSALPEADTSVVLSLEHELLAAADVACFSSVPLLEEERRLTRRSVLLRHGIDTDMFGPASTTDVHPAVAAVPGPRVGFVGTIDAYTVDLDLLDLLAERCPEVTVVLVGRIDTWVDGLLARPNVRYLGEVAFEEVPSVMAGLDVALMPWQDNEWIAHCNPVKLREYLAMGLPVVSTAFPEVDPYRRVVAVADDAESFVAAVVEAVGGRGRGTARDRRAAVSGETWDEQVRILRGELSEAGQVASSRAGSSCAVS
ncbi:MAG: glycosyltransferase, partial [Microthrixaceae bacterium]